jgi:quercetin dioxygenase-like cupin family protein
MSTSTSDATNRAFSEGGVSVFDLPALADYADPGPSVRILSDGGASRSVLFSFRAGQRLQEHRTSSAILVLVVSGAIAFEAHGHAIEASQGMLLQLEGDIPHGITARSDADLLVIMTPSPRHHSLSAEVFDKLTPLVVRSEDPAPGVPPT